MAVVLFGNNASSNLAGAISSTALTANLTAGTGVLFPNPSANQYYVDTFVDAATGLLNEIVWVTGRSTDTITIVRAQEGTTALNWLAGDIVANFWTAGQAAAMLQSGQYQTQSANYGTDVGSVNAISVVLSPAPTSLTPLIGAPIRVLLANTTTNATPTLTINGLTPLTIVNPNGSQIASPLWAGSIAEFIYDGTHAQLMSITRSQSLGAPIFITATGAWTQVVPVGVERAKVTIGGGGGGGGGCTGSQAGGGGGGGAVGIFFLTGLVPGQNLSGTIGLGGTASAGGSTAGTGGSTTLLNNSVLIATAAGGLGGASSGISAFGGTGGAITIGTFSGTSIALQGCFGMDGYTGGVLYGGNGAPGYLGAGSGRAAEGSFPGQAATSYCAGGGGSYSASPEVGGVGFQGFVLIEWSLN